MCILDVWVYVRVHTCDMVCTIGIVHMREKVRVRVMITTGGKGRVD